MENEFFSKERGGGGLLGMPDRRKSYLETFCRCDFRLKTANRAVEANFDHFLIQENQEIAIGIFLEAVLGSRVRYDRSGFFSG